MGTPADIQHADPFQCRVGEVAELARPCYTGVMGYIQVETNNGATISSPYLNNTLKTKVK
jgi:hypothetical protein